MSELLFLPIVFCDIARYSRLSIPQQQVAQVTLRQLLDEAYAISGSQPYRELSRGDGYLLLYGVGESAAALDFLRRFATGLQERLPDFQLRIGMHVGKVGVADPRDPRSEFFGPGIDRAHRVMECCDPGHILLSQEATEGLPEDLMACIHLAGNCRVKHDEYLRVYNFYGIGSSGVAFGNAATPRLIFETRRYNDTKKVKDIENAKKFRAEEARESIGLSLRMLGITFCILLFILLLVRVFLPAYFDKSIPSQLRESLTVSAKTPRTPGSLKASPGTSLTPAPYHERKPVKVEEPADKPVTVRTGTPKNNAGRGSNRVGVPYLVGEPLEEARRNCKELSLRLKVINRVASEETEETVVKQIPATGTVASGHTIQVTVSDGSPGNPADDPTPPPAPEGSHGEKGEKVEEDSDVDHEPS